MEYTQITVTRRDQVVLITLDRPERLNAWTPRMAEEQAHAITAANDDPSIGAIVMTGAGRGFCAGADMDATFKSRIDGVDPGNDTAGGRGGMPAGLDWVALVRSSKPIVCAINGAAVGIGVTMCLPADQIITSTAAKFGMGFIKMGLVPELGSTRLLAARIGLGRASDLCLSGRIISGTEAHQIGLADQLTEPDALLDTAFSVAASYAANPDVQLRMTKQLLTQNLVETDLALVQQREHAMLTEVLGNHPSTPRPSPRSPRSARRCFDRRPRECPAVRRLRRRQREPRSGRHDRRLPAPGETVLGNDYAEHPGGKGLNQAVAAARSGARTTFVSAVGDDNAAAVLLDVMQADGIDTTHVARRAGVATGRALIGVAANGENSIIVVPGANATVEVDVAAGQQRRARATRGAARDHRDRVPPGAPAWRDHGAEPGACAAAGRALLALCDVVVPNEHEAELLGGVDALLTLGRHRGRHDPRRRRAPR